ncbi:MAG: hypothetical protein NTU89_03255 [Candidatus Dependentiae bacterium]|nr:hypothetical protein [Candidatus Dependentiae bacterium]
MVHVQKNKLFLASICAVSFFGKSAQASNFCNQVKSSTVAVASSINQKSSSACHSVASHIPGLVLTSVLLDSANLVAKSVAQRSVQRGQGCPVGGLVNEKVVVSSDSKVDAEGKAVVNEVAAHVVGVRAGRVEVVAQLPVDAKNKIDALVKADYSINLPSFKHMAATLLTYVAFQKFVAKK